MPNIKSTVFLVLLSLALFAGPAAAKPEFMTWFAEQYPDSVMKTNCTMCHNTPYARDWTLAGRNFTAIENLDSDGDGIINIDEIEAEKNPGVPDTYSYYLPYFKGSSNHWTGIGLRNCSPDRLSVAAVNVYDSDGNLLESSTVTIAARGHDVFTVGAGQPNEGWIRITSTRPLVGLCFAAVGGTPNYMADIPFVSELSPLLYVPHVGQGPVYDTTVMVCNPNPSDTTVTLTFVDQQGSVLYETSRAVKTNGSWRYELKEMVQDSSKANYGSVEISASNGLCAFALYNNLKRDGSYSYAGISAVAPPD